MPISLLYSQTLLGWECCHGASYSPVTACKATRHVQLPAHKLRCAQVLPPGNTVAWNVM